MHSLNPYERLRWLFERIPGTCLIETDSEGILSYFGPAAEAFFNCPADAALGRLHYTAFHESAEMEACRDDPAFREAMDRDGWTEDEWRIFPREGEAFRARVTLVRAPARDDDAPGWIALYRRIL